MAETRISDVIVPEVFTEYTLTPTITKSRFFRSGLIKQEPTLKALIDGGGKTFNMPKWEDTTGDSGDNPSETNDQTIHKIGTYQEVARRQFRVKAWGANDMSSILAGEDAINAAAAKVVDFWAGAMDKIALQSLYGATDSAKANLVIDISTKAGTANQFSNSAVIDAQAVLGENGTMGRGDEVGGNFVAIIVDPKVYAFMRKQDLIEFVPISDQPRPVPFYMNMNVIVDRFAQEIGGSFISYIIKNGALGYSIGAANYLPTEINRDPRKGMGIDELYTRRAFVMHPYGFKWTDAAVSDSVTPTDAELATARNWQLVAPLETARFIALKHKIA